MPGRDAYNVTAESIDSIIQICVIQEVQLVTKIARVEKELGKVRP